MINWKVRLLNKSWWISMIPAVLLLIKAVAQVFGYSVDFGELGNNLMNVVECIFVVLALVGINVDPTTKGMSDSDRAMNYNEPM